MRRAIVRLLMAVVGLLSLVLYAGGAYLAYLVLRFAWLDRASAAAVILAMASVSLLFGYASYRYGTRQLLGTIETVRPPAGRASEISERLDRLCRRMDLDRPTVLFTDLDEPNAFAMSGPDGGVVVFDVSLLSILDDEELEAILAHELAHLESRDGVVQLLAFSGLQTVMSVVSLALLPPLLLLTGVAKATAWVRGRPATWSKSLAWRFRSVIVAAVMIVPIAFTFVILVRSRRQEYAADERAAAVTGDPIALARGLRTVHEAMTDELRVRGSLPAEPPTSDPLYQLLSTHPAVEERIGRLESMAERR